MTYIRHLTINTNHVRDTPSDDVPADIRAILHPLIDRALTGERVPVPGFPGYTFSGGEAGRCIALTVWADAVPLVTFGIAPRSRCDATLWQRLGQTAAAEGVTMPAVPQAPWVAVLLHAGAALYPDALDWLGDFERCCAWAWVEN